MCVAIPYGHQDKKKRSRLWNMLSNTPLGFLAMASVFQTLLLGLLWWALKIRLLDQSDLLLPPTIISLYIGLFGISLFLISGILMTCYPHWLDQSEIEYLHYAGLFFAGNFSLMLFVAGVFFSQWLIIGSLLLYLAILIFAFKPLYWIGFWANRKNLSFARLVNFSLTMVLLSLAGFILSIYSGSYPWQVYTLCLASVQWLVPLTGMIRLYSQRKDHRVVID